MVAGAVYRGRFVPMAEDCATTCCMSDNGLVLRPRPLISKMLAGRDVPAAAAGGPLPHLPPNISRPAPGPAHLQRVLQASKNRHGAFLTT